MNKTYLKYLFKSKKSLCVVICVIYALGFLTTIISPYDSLDRAGVALITISVILGIFSLIIVPIMLSYVHNKKAVDSYFSLPVSRKEMIITTELFMNTIVLIPFIILSIIALFIGLANNTSIQVGWYFLYILIGIIGVIAFIAFESAVYLEANSPVDGIILMGAYLLMPLFVMLAINTFQDSLIIGMKPIDTDFVFKYVSLPSSIIYSEIKIANVIYCIDCVIDYSFIPFIVCVVTHSIAAFIGLKKNFVLRKVERAETISNNFFSYPFVINIYTAILIFSYATNVVKGEAEDYVFALFSLFVTYMIANFIYQRKIKIVLKKVIFFICVTAITVGFTFVAYKTKGFGLSNIYDHNPKNYAYSLTTYVYMEDNDDLSDTKLRELVDYAFDDVDNFTITAEAYIDNPNSIKNKEAINVIERIRKESIEHFYSNDDDWFYSPFNDLCIITNYKEKEKYISDAKGESLSDETHYRYSRNASFDELLILNEVSDVLITVNKYGDSEQTITLDKLLLFGKNSSSSY